MSSGNYFTTTTQTIPGLIWIYNINTLNLFTPQMETLTTKEKHSGLIYQFDVYIIKNQEETLVFNSILN
jgi:hypothetical protein